MRTAALVPAAGLGLRLGAGSPKALRRLAGQPLVWHAVTALAAAPSVELVVVAAPAGELTGVRDLLAGAPGGRLPAAGGDVEVRVVAGGATRRASVAAALAAVPPGPQCLLVHDAARPLVPASLVEAVAAAVAAGAPAVVPGLVPVDTIKIVDVHGRVSATPPREMLRAVQTPQGFRRDILEAAHAQSDSAPATDDAGLVELLGVPVEVVTGHPLAVKVTTVADLAALEAVLAAQAAPTSAQADATSARAWPA